MLSANTENNLAAGLAELRLSLPADVQVKLLQYLQLIEKWNRVHNLTAVRGIDAMLKQHLLDSLAVLPHIVGARIADVGSGAGLPGIPLALARPDWQVTLIESNHKKAAFLRQAKTELRLENLDVLCERVENFMRGASPETAAQKFDTVISRAFSDLAEFVNLAGHLCAKSSGRLLAMKGVYPHEEARHLPPNCKLERVITLAVPGLDASRHLVVMEIH